MFAPGSRTEILLRRRSRRPFAAIRSGDVVRVRGRAFIAQDVTSVVERQRQVTKITTKCAANVIAMPNGDDDSIVAQFIRFHVLVRVFDGNPDAWLEHLQACGDDSGDVRFARWIRARLRHDPMLLGEIRRMVDATPFWRAAEA